MAKKNKYDWKKTFKKFGWSLAEILIVGSLVVITDTPELLVLVPLLEATKNWIKNRNK